MRRLLITNEHGAWVILAVPVLSVIFVSGEYSLKAVLLMLSALSWFMVYKPAELLINAYHRFGKPGIRKQTEALYWLPKYAAIAFILSTMLLLHSEAWMLIPAGGIIAVLFVLMKLFMNTAGYSPLRNFTGTLLLTSGGFLADITFNGTFTQRGISASVINLLFFTISSSFADLKMRELREDAGKVIHARLIIPAFFIIAAAVLSGLYLAGYIRPLWLLPGFLPLLVHFAADRFRMTPSRNFKQLGLILMTYSILLLVTLPYAVQ